VEPVERGREGTEVGLPGGDPLSDQPERGHQPAQARVGRELPEEGLGVDGRVQQIGQSLGIEEQQPVAY